jgi:hypothetical protein
MSDQQTQATAVADEQAADLAKLQAQVQGEAPAQIDTTRAAETDDGGELPPPSQAAMQIAAMAVGMLKPIVCFAVPVLREAPDDLWQPVPEGVAAVLDEYGASAEWMRSPWARLGMSLMPLMAFAAVSAMNKPKKPEPMALEAAPPAEPVGQKTVTFGANDANGAQLG